MENFYPPNLKNQNLDFFKNKNDFPPNKIGGGCAPRGIDLEQSKITENPVKYIVPDICDRNTEKGKFAKQMGM